MEFQMSGKLTSREIVSGTKPMYIDLPAPTRIKLECGCNSPNCNDHPNHGLIWDCSWKGEKVCGSVQKAIDNKLAYWLKIQEIIGHKNPDIKYSCNIMKTSQMAKNVKLKIRIWKQIKKKIQNQILSGVN